MTTFRLFLILVLARDAKNKHRKKKEPFFFYCHSLWREGHEHLINLLSIFYVNVFSIMKVSSSSLVGEEHGAALCMMRNLEIERIALAAMSLGIARRSVEVCL